MISLTTVTGQPITGLTTPTYTVTTDVGPTLASKQWAITALGGTQTGVNTHTPSKPFTVTFKRPATLKSLGSLNPTTGRYSTIPVNEYAMIVRKGMSVDAVYTGNIGIGSIDVRVKIPAGADIAAAAEVSALFSAAIGALTQQAQGFKDTAVTAVL